MPPSKRFVSLPDVHCSGEPLGSPVYWLGLQWAVTADGVERRDGNYVIEKDRVHEADGGYTWEDHIAAKGWADMQDFRAAMEFARRRWPKRRAAKVVEVALDKAPKKAKPVLGDTLAVTDIIVDRSHTLSAVLKHAPRSAYVEFARSGSTGLKHLPADQRFAVDVRELRGLIRVLRQAEASAVRHGLLDRTTHS